MDKCSFNADFSPTTSAMSARSAYTLLLPQSRLCNPAIRPWRRLHSCGGSAKSVLRLEFAEFLPKGARSQASPRLSPQRLVFLHPPNLQTSFTVLPVCPGVCRASPWYCQHGQAWTRHGPSMEEALGSRKPIVYIIRSDDAMVQWCEMTTELTRVCTDSSNRRFANSFTWTGYSTSMYSAYSLIYRHSSHSHS